MPSVEPRILKGFRDYLPEEMLPRQRMLEAIERVLRSYGYLPLQTPALEYADVLLGKYGDEGDSLLYRFLDNGQRDVALRYDLTVPLARVVAMHPELPRPFRRYQIAPVWRAEKPARGRFREFMQCDGDIIGSRDQVADAEVIQLGAEMLRALGVERFKVRVNNRKVLTGLMEAVGVAPGAEEMGVLRTIDKLPKLGPEATRELLLGENKLAAERIDRIFEFLEIVGSPRQILERLERFFAAAGGGMEAGRTGAAELREVFDLLAAVDLGDAAEIDLSIARGLNYYTGTVYETFLEGLPGFGAVMSGGRYDGLIGSFAREEIPGVGISLGIDRLIAGLGELGLMPPARTTADVLVTVFDPSTAPRSAAVARRLRAAGIACELFPQAAKIGKQLRWAERAGKRLAVIIGPEEAARNIAQVKDLAARTQAEIPIDELGARLQAMLAAGPAAAP